jgi:hypothetical protein
VARRNRANGVDEETMAQKIDSNCARFVDLTLAEAGIESQGTKVGTTDAQKTS